MVATLARVQRATAAEPWYNTYCCAQKPPEIGALVTLARGARRESRAACVVETKEKARVVVGLAASHHADLAPGAESICPSAVFSIADF